MLPTVSATIAGIALVVSVIVFFDNRRRAAEAARLARVPTLVFTWDASGQTWMLTNIGNGPALDVVILQRIGGQWVHPLRMPEMAVQDSNSVPTRWVGWNENPGLGARYRSITGERYMTKTGDDWSQQSPGWGDMPSTLWNQIEPHWRYDEPVSVLDLPESRHKEAEGPAGGLDHPSNALSGQPGIAISYRRQDAPAYAGRLYDDLASSFGPELLFMDFDTGPGLDEQGIASAGTLLVLIGPGWLGAKDSDGNRRLDDPHDPVRLVIEHSLRQGVRVIPVLVGGASMPSTEELPQALASLAWRHPVEITDSTWRADSAQLRASLSKLLAESERSRPRPSGQPE
jgi:hypothetical protein